MEQSYYSRASFSMLNNTDMRPLRMEKSGSIYHPYDSVLVQRRKQSFAAPKAAAEKGLTVFGASLAFISTIIGAGIVSLPYALHNAGYVVGIILHLMMLGFMSMASYLLLKTKDNLGFESLGELAFICLGRSSVFVINFILTLAESLILIMFALLFSKICVSFAEDILTDEQLKNQSFIYQALQMKITYCILLYIVSFHNILKKQMKELKIISQFLFFGIISLVVIFLVKEIAKEFADENTTLTRVKVEPYKNGTLIDSISIILTSYSFIINFYPIYSSMERRTNTNTIKATSFALAFCFTIYFSFSILGIISYGDEINPDIFENIKVEKSISSLVVRFIFMCIFLCNLPFIFLPGKESLLILIDELMNKSMSESIKNRIDIITDLGRSLIEVEEKDATKTGFQNYTIQQEEKAGLQACNISQKVKPSIYYTWSIGLFTFQMACAVLIDDITIIFGFFAAFADSMLNFLLPGLFYIQSCKIMNKKMNPVLLVASIVYIILGIAVFIFSNYNTIKKFYD